MDTNATSFASPLASAKDAVTGALPAQVVPVINALANLSVWQVLLTLFVGAVLYDQSGLSFPRLRGVARL